MLFNVHVELDSFFGCFCRGTSMQMEECTREIGKMAKCMAGESMCIPQIHFG